MTILIKGGTIIDNGQQRKGSIVVENDRITAITIGNNDNKLRYDKVINAEGCIVIPGVVDSHVHFREPGLTTKGDIATESRAAAAGGVTTFFDMPNTRPATNSQETLDDKMQRSHEKSRINYAFFLDASSPKEFLTTVDTTTIPGLKLFMGTTTSSGGILRGAPLRDALDIASTHSLTIVAHCEDDNIIARNMAHYMSLYPTEPPAACHTDIRSAEACYTSAAMAREMAKAFDTRLHIAHVSTARELSLLNTDKGITGEVCTAYLLFDRTDYNEKGALLKVNPAIKEPADRKALIEAVKTGAITTIASDHAPHQLVEKQGGATTACSGMPMVQFSLPAMLTLAEAEDISLEQVVKLMCHNPASLFRLKERGFLREGYKADITIVKPKAWVVRREDVISKCRWSPLEGRQLAWQVATTICNGHIVFNEGQVIDTYTGEAACFNREN